MENIKFAPLQPLPLGGGGGGYSNRLHWEAVPENGIASF